MQESFEEFIRKNSYFNRQGKPIDLFQLGKLFKDKNYQLLKRDYIGPYLISTVWLGINHNIMDTPPLIFETMIFNIQLKDDDEDELDHWMHRYSTEEEALKGHEEAVELCNERIKNDRF